MATSINFLSQGYLQSKADEFEQRVGTKKINFISTIQRIADCAFKVIGTASLAALPLSILATPLLVPAKIGLATCLIGHLAYRVTNVALNNLLDDVTSYDEALRLQGYLRNLESSKDMIGLLADFEEMEKDLKEMHANNAKKILSNYNPNRLCLLTLIPKRWVIPKKTETAPRTPKVTTYDSNSNWYKFVKFIGSDYLRAARFLGVENHQPFEEEIKELLEQVKNARGSKRVPA